MVTYLGQASPPEKRLCSLLWTKPLGAPVNPLGVWPLNPVGPRGELLGEIAPWATHCP